MTLESDQPCVVNLQKQTSTCSGNVVISQGTMQLRAERLELRETPEGWQQAQATGADGKPARFRQKRDGVDETVEGQAQRLHYDSRTGVLRFEGAAVVRRLRGIAVADEIQGASIVWDSLAEQFSVQGGAATAANPSRPGARGDHAQAAADERRPARPPPACGRARRWGTGGERAAAAAAAPAGSAPAGTSRLRGRRPARSAMARARSSRTCTWPWPAARWSACSAPTAPARPPRSTWGSAWCGPMPARSTSTAWRSSASRSTSAPRMGLSYLPQEASIFRKLTVEENIRAVLELQHDAQGRPLGQAAINQQLEQLLHELSIESCAIRRRRRCRAASGDGSRSPARWPRSRASSCSTSRSPASDPIAVLEIQRIIGFLKQRGIGVLITDHNVREMLGICDRAYIISEGRVLAEGTPAEIVENADVRRVYLGEHFRM